MRREILTALTAVAVLVLALAAPAPAHAQQALQLNQPQRGSASGDNPAVFTFDAESAGVLTVVLRGDGDADLQLAVADAVGQPLPEGQSDMDLGGNMGAEQLAVTIPGAGQYQVRVTMFYGSGTFEMVAGFISYPALAGPMDPDGMPTAAAELTPGSPIQDSIDPASGDAWDWFKVTVDSAAAVTVITSAESGDLALEVFEEGNYAEAINRSDQDMQGVAGNESLTIQASPGQTYYFKVSPVFGNEAVSYTIRVGIM
ncbi:MAG: PPC domain-containing protein [Acidobacteriota bacterium]|jgi:hypothetical protein